MKLALLNALFITVCSNLLFSQTTISGSVKDRSGRAISFATVQLLSGSPFKVVRFSTTNENGHFEMHINDSITAVVKFICATYLKRRSDTLAVTPDNASYSLSIEKGSLELSEVTITGVAPLMLRQADRFIFTPDKTLTQGASALELMRITPLIQFDNKTETFSIINKEGTIVYINNRKSNMPKEMIIAMLKSSPADNIKSIEIITNPGSEYTANTTGGVININVKKLMDEGWFGNVSLTSEQSFYNTSMFNGALNYRKNKVGIRLSPFLNNSFNYYTIENLISPAVEHYEANTRRRHRKYLVLGGGLALDYDMTQRDLLSFNAFFSVVNGKYDQQSQTRYYMANSASNDSIYHAPIEGKDHYIYNFGNIYYRHAFNGKRSAYLVFNIDYNYFYQRNTDIGNFTKEHDVTGGGYRNILPEKFFNISESADYAVTINKRSKFSVGGQVSNTVVSDDLRYEKWNEAKGNYEPDASLTNLFKYEETYMAIYASYTMSLSDKINAIAGLRAEQTDYSTQNVTKKVQADSSYIKLFPNLSLSWQPDKNHVLSLSMSKKIKRAAIELLFPGRTYYNPTYYTENNPFLQPVIVNNAELMFTLQNKYYFTGGYTLSDNQYAQFIVPDEEDGRINQKRTYLNYGNISSTYFNFYTTQRFFKGFWDMNLSASLNYYAYKVKSVNELLDIKTINNVNYNFSLSNNIYLSRKKKWSAFAAFRYYSPVENISFKRENVLFTADAGISKAFERLSFNLYLTDIFNTGSKNIQRYHANAAYVYNRIVQNNYTRSISLTVRYSFGNNKLSQVKNKRSANEDIKSRVN